jgi:hypothetical protein
MRWLRRLIWFLVLALAALILVMMLALPTRPAWIANAPLIGWLLKDCSARATSRC